MLDPAVAVGIERLVGCVAESLAVYEESDFLALLDEELLEIVECDFDVIDVCLCHIFCS